MNSNSNPDRQAILLLCTYVAAPSDSDVTPLSPREWFQLAQRIERAGLDGPGALFEMDRDSIGDSLDISPDNGARIFDLLRRGGQLAFEMERFHSRGIWVLTVLDEQYPSRYKERLPAGALPPVLFGAGDVSLLNATGVAIVGSRNVDGAGGEFTKRIAKLCTAEGYSVVSGAARGVDTIAMSSAVAAGGTTVGILADSLENFLAKRDVRIQVLENKCVLITPFHPRMRFTVANAMSRNKLIYSLADHAIVACASHGSGGTWAGATEALRLNLCGVFVRTGTGVPEGNAALLKKGAFPLPDTLEAGLSAIFDEKASAAHVKIQQQEIALDVSGDKKIEIPIKTSHDQPVDDAKTARLRGISESDEIFSFASKLALRFFSAPHTRQELESYLNLTPQQAKQWLDLMENSGSLNRSGRPARFQHVADSDDSRDNTINDGSPAEELYSYVSRNFAGYMKMPRSEKEIQQRFRLVPVQVKAWIGKMQVQGIVEKKLNPLRYVFRHDLFTEDASFESFG